MAAILSRGMFGDEDADADSENHGLDHLDDDPSGFAAYASTRLVEVRIQDEFPEEGLLPSVAPSASYSQPPLRQPLVAQVEAQGVHSDGNVLRF